MSADLSGLSWFTDLTAAIAEARRTQRPILSLRLLGRLDQELSCANSRMFRRLLYPEPRINRMLRERYVVHWESLRPVPVVTIDFGNGRRVVRTLTGNSVHLVLDSHGRPVDAMPGLVLPDTFVQWLERGLALARCDRKELALHHERWLRQPAPLPRESRAMLASRVAMAKHVVEAPVLRAVSPVELDNAQALQLHARVGETFARGTPWTVEALVGWIYRDLFLMPPDDPFLGLDVPDPV
jgi:hypothetical protein